MLTCSTVTSLNPEDPKFPDILQKKVSSTKEMKDIIGNYCYMTQSYIEIRISDHPCSSLFGNNNLPTNDEPQMDETYYYNPPYNDYSDNLIDGKIPL